MEQGFQKPNYKTQSRQNPKENLKHKLAKPKAVYETQSSLQNTEEQNANQKTKHKLGKMFNFKTQTSLQNT